MHGRRLQRVASIALAVGATLLSGGGGFSFAVFADEAPTSAAPLHQQIDQHMEEAGYGISAPPASDEHFLRRVYLDLAGRIPSPDVVRAFLEDQTPDKRQAVVDRLLTSPEFARHMATSFDIMLMERRSDKQVKADQWESYLYESLAQNKPLNQLAREILSADGQDKARRAPAKFYLEREGEPNLLTRDVGRMFFGMDLQCAQCHDHPLIYDYSQHDYYGFYAFFNRSYLFTHPKNKTTVLAEKAEGEVQFKSVFTEEEGNALPRVPGSEPIADPPVQVGAQYVSAPAKDTPGDPTYSRREQLARQVTDGSNAYFNRNWANRLWAHMMGRGLFDPVDLYHSDNPPADPALLDLLGERLVEMNFDVRRFLRELALTRVYQRSALTFTFPDAVEPLENAAQQHDAELAQQIEAVEQQLKDQADTLIASAEAYAAADGKFQEVTEPYGKALKAATELKGKLDAASKTLGEAEQKHAAKAEYLATLSAAAQAARTAADKLPSEKELEQAAALFESRTKKAEAELKPLTVAFEKAQQAAQAQTAAFQEADEKLKPLAAQRQQTQTALVEAQAALHQAQTLQESTHTQLNHLKQQRDDLARLAEVASLRQALAGSESKLQSLVQQKQALESRLQAAVAAAEQSDEVEAERPPAPESAERAENAPKDAAQADADAEKATAGSSDTLATVRQELEAVRTELDQLQSQTAQQQQDLNSQQAELQDRWTQRFAVGALKPLSPEQLGWSMMQATGYLDRIYTAAEAEFDKKRAEAQKKAGDKPLPELSEQQRAQEIEQLVHEKVAGGLNAFARTFGAAEGQPQNDFFATVDQALFLSNAGTLQSWLNPGGGNLTERLMKLEDPQKIADELYLSILSRLPTEAERQLVQRYLNGEMSEAANPDDRDEAKSAEESGPDKAAAVQEMAWGLLTSAEFRFNH